MSGQFTKDEQLFGCGKCLKYFIESDDAKKCFYNHVAKPFACSFCDASFYLNYVLQCHLRTHTGERPFKCKVCHAAFAQNGHLTMHMRIHTCVRLYKCKVCDVVFHHRSSLIHHQLKHINHTEKRPFHTFPCLKCPSASRWDYNLKSRDYNRKSRDYNLKTRDYNLKSDKHDKCATSLTLSLTVRKNHNHTGDRSFKCDVCGLAFFDDIIMGIHRRSHSVQQQH